MTGKTFMINEIAKKLNIPFYKYSCSRDSSVHDLIGYKQPASEEYLMTSFLQAYENGGIFLVDEYDAMPGDMALFFNGVADDSDFISIPHRDSNPTAKRHKNFRLVLAGNTWGKGSIEYSGRDFQDLALLDRFRFSKHFIGYHKVLEKAVMGDNYSFALALRDILEKVGSYLSTRNIVEMAKVIQAGYPLKDVINIIIEDLNESDKKLVREKLSFYYGS